MHSSPQFTRSTLSGKFTWVRAIKFGGSFMVMGNFPVGGGAIFAGAIILGGDFFVANFPWWNFVRGIDGVARF